MADSATIAPNPCVEKEPEPSLASSASAEQLHVLNTLEAQSAINSDATVEGASLGSKAPTDEEHYQGQIFPTIESSESSGQEVCKRALAHQDVQIDPTDMVSATFPCSVAPKSNNDVSRWRTLRWKYGTEPFKRFSLTPSSSRTSLASTHERSASKESAEDVVPIVLDTSPPIQRRELFLEEDVNCMGGTMAGNFFERRRLKSKRVNKMQNGDDGVVGLSGKQQINGNCALPEGPERSAEKSDYNHHIPLSLDRQHEDENLGRVDYCTIPLSKDVPDSTKEISPLPFFVHYLFPFRHASVLYPINEQNLEYSQAEFAKPKLDVSPSSVRKATPEGFLLMNESSPPHRISPDVGELEIGKVDESEGRACGESSFTIQKQFPDAERPPPRLDNIPTETKSLHSPPGSKSSHLPISPMAQLSDVISSSPSAGTVMEVEQGPKSDSVIRQTSDTPPLSPEMSDTDFAEDGARRIWEGDETFVASVKAAEYLGKQGEKSQKILQSYLEKYDFTGQRIDTAFRTLCSRLYLRAESQQIDRILAAFSRRYHNCNPTPGSMAPHPFLNEDEIHTVIYSLLLLNTDLHVAAIGAKMTRSEYVRNTIRTLSLCTQIKTNGVQSMDESRQSEFRDANTTTSSIKSDVVSIKSQASQKRWSMPWGEKNPENDNSQLHSATERVTELSNLLKELYTAIKVSRILYPEKIETLLSNDSRLSPTGNGWTSEASPSSTASSPGPSGSSTLPRSFFSRRLIRTQSSSSFSRLDHNDEGSLLGRGVATLLGRSGSQRGGTLSTRRSMFGSAFLGEGSAGGSSVSSSPILHPSMRPPQSNASATSSVHERNFSVSTFNSLASRNTMASGADTFSEEPSPPLTSPYIMEGQLIRKHYLERENKQANGRTWKKSYVVFDDVELRIFNTMASGKTGYEHPVITLSILHSLATALPTPGYSRNRPHVFALTQPTGCVYLFQAASASLVQEWVTAINLQAARKSKEPLPTGITNFEYGWGRILDEVDENGDPCKEFVDKDVNIREWKAPSANVLAVSQLDEAKQLANLRKQLVDLETEIERHHKLRQRMDLMIPVKSKSYGKAIANWEKRSQHLLREHVKYQLYADNLQRVVKDSLETG